ncbi:hypothetical protein P43SY_007139 [Pythium insidiosum]|uniref:mitogen-activated protein kinase kinase n=1 Tax=Pythium insidiosum TaxID=114742 RepID=A0AAD5LX26_PYTIN|nr:hypothetical protein P43SY_007139 [Pythium insidiosum]
MGVEVALLGQLCAKRNCYREVFALYGAFCEFHKPSRLCKVPECRKCAKTGGYCIAHGGGRRCSIAACPKSAKDGGLCISHGGGKRCRHEGGCSKAAVSGGLCTAHRGRRPGGRKFLMASPVKISQRLASLPPPPLTRLSISLLSMKASSPRDDLTCDPAGASPSRTSLFRPRDVMSLSFIINPDEDNDDLDKTSVLHTQELEHVQDDDEDDELSDDSEGTASSSTASPTRETETAPGLFQAGTSLCSKRNCYRAARAFYSGFGAFCEFHKPSRLCKEPDCQKCAKTGGYCISHGGGRRCHIDGCIKSAKEGGFCIAHGGGKRCRLDNCSKSALSGGLCSAHGGGKRCSVDDCNKTALKGGRCIAHGGGRRCEVEGCTKSAVGGRLGSSMNLNNSFVAGAGAYVKGKYAITPTGVVMKGTGRAFSVVPEELDWDGAVIGRGCSGSVLRSCHRPTNTPLALKMINMFDKSKREQIMREINALFDSNCPCLVTFYGAFLRDSAVVIALEYMDGGSLENVIHQLGTIPEHVLGNIAFQILYALSYLKTHKRLHRDIKPPNILLNSRGLVKLSDFGIATELGSSLAMCGTFVGTFRYMSPERIEGALYSYDSDIWSLGLVLMEAATGVYPYPKHKTCIDMIQALRESPPPTLSDKYFSAEFCEFLRCCLQREPLDRASADVLLESPWLQRCGAINLEAAVANVRHWIQSLQ